MTNKTDKLDIELNGVRLTPGYRWRVFDGGNLICTGTDYHDTEESALEEARKYFCENWEGQE